MPHSPHTISSRTISSVATNTSRVNPTLCHILEAGGGRLRATRRWAPAGGQAARPGFQRRAPGAARRWGGMGYGRPLRSAPRGRGGARQAQWPTRRTDPPSYPGRRSAGEGGPRGAPIPSSLRRAGDAAPGDHGGGRMRFHGGHHAPVDRREGEHRDARRPHGLRHCPPE